MQEKDCLMQQGNLQGAASGFMVSAKKVLKSRDHPQSRAAVIKHCFLHQWEAQTRREGSHTCLHKATLVLIKAQVKGGRDTGLELV